MRPEGEVTTQIFRGNGRGSLSDGLESVRVREGLGRTQGWAGVGDCGGPARCTGLQGRKEVCEVLSVDGSGGLETSERSDRLRLRGSACCPMSAARGQPLNSTHISYHSSYPLGSSESPSQSWACRSSTLMSLTMLSHLLA